MGSRCGQQVESSKAVVARLVVRDVEDAQCRVGRHHRREGGQLGRADPVVRHAEHLESRVGPERGGQHLEPRVAHGVAAELELDQR